MRVLKPGRPREEVLLRGACVQCGCEIECPLGEAKNHFDPRNDATWLYAKCPTAGCNGNIRLSPPTQGDR